MLTVFAACAAGLYSQSPPAGGASLDALSTQAKASNDRWLGLNQRLEENVKSSDRSEGFCLSFRRTYADLWQAYLDKEQAEIRLNTMRMQDVDAKIELVNNGASVTNSVANAKNLKAETVHSIDQYQSQLKDLTQQLNAPDTSTDAKADLQKAIAVLNQTINLGRARLDQVQSLPDTEAAVTRSKSYTVQLLKFQKQYFEDFLKGQAIYQASYELYYKLRWLDVTRGCVAAAPVLPGIPCGPGKPCGAAGPL